MNKNPAVKNVFRWNRAKPSRWKVNLAKENRSKCLSYVTKTGEKPTKMPKSVDCSKCRYKCQEHFLEQDRKKICEFYWGMRDYNRQKDFILKFVKTLEPKRQTGKSGARLRNESRAYYLADSQKNLWRVCSNFFTKTLCISNGPVNMALSNTNFLGLFGGSDKRGKKVPGNKMGSRSLELVKGHIEMLPTVPAHYVRKSSKRRYLEPTLTVRKMYRLYVAYCSSIHENPVKCSYYRYVFGTQYNLS